MELAIQLAHVNAHTFSTAEELKQIISSLDSQKLKPNKKENQGLGWNALLIALDYFLPLLFN